MKRPDKRGCTTVGFLHNGSSKIGSVVQSPSNHRARQPVDDYGIHFIEYLLELNTLQKCSAPRMIATLYTEAGYIIFLVQIRGAMCSAPCKNRGGGVGNAVF